MAEINDFDAMTSEEVIQQLRDLKREVKNLRRQFHLVGKPQQPSPTYVAQVTEEAAAMNSGVASKGKAEIQSVKHTGDVVRKTSPAEFFNFSLQKAEVGDYVALVVDPYSGRLIMPPSPGEGYVPFDFWHGGIDIPGGSSGAYGDWTTMLFIGLVNGDSVPISHRRDVRLSDAKLLVDNAGFRHFVVAFQATHGDLSYDSTLPMPFQLRLVVNSMPVGGSERDFYLPPRSGVSAYSGGATCQFCCSFTYNLDADDAVQLQVRSTGDLYMLGQAAVGPGVVF